MTTDSRPPQLDRLHDVLVLLLVAMRPWCWDGAPGQPADLLWQGLAVGALLIAAIERAAGWSAAWAWSWRGVAAVGLVLALVPSALHAAEPAPAWCRWTGWVACLAGAAYVMQMLPGRQRLALAGLAAGLAVTAVFGVTQPLWVLPAMATAQQAGANVFTAIGGDPGAIAERLANGGTFATFTLANQFGAYLALLVPIIAGGLWIAGAPGTSTVWQRLPAALLLVIALLALSQTSAKGAWLALAAGAAFAWWLAWRGHWWRWLPLPLGILACIALSVSGAARASIDVRLGYWRSAVTLANEAPLTGHGLGGFAAHQARVMLAGDEPTRYVHNEVLEAAVAGGWGLAVLAVIALFALAWPRRTTSEPLPAIGPPRALVLALFIAVPYLALYGAFDGNLGWWPGGGGFFGGLAWAAVLGVIAALVAAVWWRATPPPAWAWAAGLLAVALKALIDFDFHATGVIGTALLAAACAGGPLRQASGAMGRWLPLATALLAMALVVSGMFTGLRLSEADDWIAHARRSGDAQVAAALAQRLGADPSTPPQALVAQAAEHAWDAADGAPGSRLAALELMPASASSLDRAAALAEVAPHSAAIALEHARRLIAGREWSAAVAEAERAVRLAPTAPRILALAAEVMERASPKLPTASTRAATLRAAAEHLRPLVHPGMR